MSSEQEVHLGRSLCVLCRQAATVGSHILDPNENLHTVPDCGTHCGPCIHSRYPGVWFHPACYHVLQNSYEPSKKPTAGDLRLFADATRPAYECHDKEHREAMSAAEGLFSKYTREIIQDSFRQNLLRQLPFEIITMISELISPCWYLTVLGETRRLIEILRDTGGLQSKDLSLEPEMWVSRLTYRGTSYVAQLSDKPLKSAIPSEQCHIKLPDDISKIILSVDCIGIRGIQFVGHKSHPTPDGSPWYEILDARNTDLKVHMSCDGLFMRSIQLVSSSVSKHRAWSSPFPPKFHPWNFFQYGSKSRLDYIQFDSRIRGILACCAKGKTVGIHGFSDISKTFREFINLMNQRMPDSHKHWIYFPFNRHEHIQAAWIRKVSISQGLDPVLVVSRSFLVPRPWLTIKLQTSIGRTVAFGPSFPAHLLIEDIYGYIPLVRNGDGAISGIFHNGLDPAVKHISQYGVTCDDQYDVGPVEPPPIDTRFDPPPVPPGRGSIAHTWYMTKASLNGLVKVQVCRDKEQSHHPCLGLLLYYSDEHIEVIGQVCWDHDLTQEAFMPIYVEKGVIDGRDYIKDIRSSIHDTGLDEETREWQKLPEYGIIVWWFGKIGDRINTYDD